jgi:hypothetical protein
VAASLLCAAALGFLAWDSLVEKTPADPQRPGQVAEGPEVMDERYFLMVKHVPGLEEPVVCFFRKDDSEDGADDAQPEAK